MKKIVIAIDGFSSCGKSTMAKELAKKIGYIYIDSGAMYRAVTLFALENNIIADNGNIDVEKLKSMMKDINIEFRLNPETHLPETWLNNKNVEKEIRNMRVSNNVSKISAIPFVRHKMVELQQKLGEKKGIVMDGRDIGTTEFPDAELKSFVTTPPDVRAQRRVDEMHSKGEDVSFEEVLENVKSRDHIDQTREESPLKKADDALELDNSHLTIEEQDKWLEKHFNDIINS